MKKILVCGLALIILVSSVIPMQSVFAMDKSMVEGAVYNDSVYTEKTTYGSVYSFDDLSEFVYGKDYTDGGNYTNARTGVVLTNAKDHTGTLLGGKSLLIKDRTYNYNRIKLLNSISNKPLTNSDIGKHFTVSAYLMSDEAATFSIGLFNTTANHKYSTSMFYSDKKTVAANEWTRFEFEFTVTKAFVDNSINTVGFLQHSGSENALIYLDDIVVTYAGDTVIFDNLDSFNKDTDFILGGAYPVAAENYVLTSDDNHVAQDEDGKCFKLSGRTKVEHRVKFKNLMGEAFTNDDIGKTYEISLYVKTSIDTKMRIGTYGDVNTTYAYSPHDNEMRDVKANTWTKMSASLIVDADVVENQINMIGVDQPFLTGVEVTPSFYIDDITVRTENYSFSNSNKTNSDELFANLPEGTKVFEPNELLAKATFNTSASKFQGTLVTNEAWQNYGFTQAARFRVSNKPTIPWSYQKTLKNFGDTAKKLDQFLVVCYIRGVTTEAADEKCHIQFIIEDTYDDAKILQSDFKFSADGRWKKCYFPSGQINDYTETLNFNIRCGYEIQEFEVADLNVYYYSATDYPNLTYDDMPESVSIPCGIEPGEDWRKQAEERIKLIRMGKASVNVKDQNGNALENVKIDFDMKDHEFQFGSAINGTVTRNLVNYDNTIKGYFNTAVFESEHKWVQYEKNPTLTRTMYNKAKTLGIKNVRGHTLIWDRDYMSKPWKDNTSIPQDIAQNYNNKTYLDTRIENHINAISTDYKGQLCDWDVVNELTNNHCMTELYNKETLAQWFNWAKQYDPDATRYINETGITGTGDDHLNRFCAYLDYMVQNNVDFEGIGVQSHFSAACNIEDFKAQLDRLASYGKRLKITEFDFNKNGNLQSDFTRDIILLSFSLPQVDGFLGWGFWDSSHWLHNAMLFDKNWNLKNSGKQYVNLVFNNWWSDESGITDENGNFSKRVFYGDYEVTAKYMGHTVKKTVSFNRGDENEVDIVFDTDSFEFTPAKLTGRNYNFDNVSSFVSNTDFVAGGAYPNISQNIKISGDEDHTSGTGKSLSLKGRTKQEHRVKLTECFGNSTFGGGDLGKTFEISCYVKPSTSGNVCIGVYGPANTTYATSPYKSKKSDVTEGEWNKITLNVTIDQTMVDKNVNMLGIGQTSGAVIPEMYVDDILIKELTRTENFDGDISDISYEHGGNYSKSNLLIKDGAGTDGSKAFAITNRVNESDRGKLKNFFKQTEFAQSDIGKTYKVAMNVKADTATKIRLGVYGKKNTPYQTQPHSYGIYNVGTDWKRIIFAFTVDQNAVENGADMLGICQTGTNSAIAENIYVDDIEIVGAKGYEPLMNMVYQTASATKNTDSAVVNVKVVPWINYDEALESYDVCVASYRNGELLDIKTETVTNTSTENNISKTINYSDGDIIKTFVLNSNAMPLCKDLELN